MPSAWEFLWGPCTGLVFPKRDGLGVTQMLMISTTFQPSLSQWHRLQDDTNYCMRKGAAGLPIKAQNQQEQVHKCLAIQGEMKGQVYYKDRPARENIASVDQLYDPYIATKTYILPVGFYFFFLKWKQTDSNILQEGFHLKNVYQEAHFLTNHNVVLPCSHCCRICKVEVNDGCNTKIQLTHGCPSLAFRC